MELHQAQGICGNPSRTLAIIKLDLGPASIRYENDTQNATGLSAFSGGLPEDDISASETRVRMGTEDGAHFELTRQGCAWSKNNGFHPATGIHDQCDLFALHGKH
jgi:hypothetical protein